MEDSFVHTTVANGVCTICFYNKASNSLNSEQLKEITFAIQNASAENSVKVILIKSEGPKAFCAGASFDELLTIDTLPEATAFFNGFAKVINAMLTCTKLIVTQVQGKAVGGAVGILAASDVVFAHESAALKLSELSIGIGPFVIEPIISHKIGKVNTSKLAYHPTQWKDVLWAANVGLYDEVFSSQSELDEKTQSYVSEMASYSEDALIALKQIFSEEHHKFLATISQRASISGQLLLNNNTKEFLKKFKSK